MNAFISMTFVVELFFETSDFNNLKLISLTAAIIKMIQKSFLTYFLILIVLSSAQAQKSKKEHWVDSVFNELSESEKIAQMFLIQASSHWEDNKLQDVEREIRTETVGGVVFTTGHPLKQLEATRNFQSVAKVPLFIAQDIPNGLGSLLDSTITFPTPLALGATTSDSSLWVMSKEIARQLKMLGVNMNIGLNANLATRTDITPRSATFGEERFLVTRKALTFLKAMQSEGILTCAKYFPIEGITITDIEKDVPVLHSFVDSLNAYPFGQLFKQGLPAVMPASKDLPLFYESKKAARKNDYSGAVLSSSFAGDWIRKQMKFNGLVVIDINTLEAASDRLKNGDAELFAFQAGNDVFITSGNIDPAIRKIRRLLKKEKQYEAQLENSVKKILGVKYDAQLYQKRELNTDNLLLKLNKETTKVLQQKIFRETITVVKNTDNTIPILSLENKKFASIVVGDTAKFNDFHRLVSKYVKSKRISVRSEKDVNRVQNIINSHDVVIVAFTSLTTEAITQQVAEILKTKKIDQQVIAVDLGAPGFGKYVNDLPVIVEAYAAQQPLMTLIPQVIFGGIASQGILPASLGTLQAGTGIKTKSLNRLGYSIPEDVGMSGNALKKIESIAKEAISIGATPGCHVLVARDGKIVYEKSFGYLTYENQTPVTDSTIYDLASVTKVSATLQTTMFMHDRGLIDIYKKARIYLPELGKSNKKDFTLKDILTHQAGLWPFLPFWAQTMKDSNYLPEYYAKEPSLRYPYVVADHLYASSAIRDTVWNWIVKAKIREKPQRTPYDYRYSDMGFYVLQRLGEKILNQPIEDFLEQNLYEPLGAYTTGYLPLMRYPISRIAPTENDKLFRKSLLIGTVHDQGAAMLGGVAGHAGLFSTANDLAKLGQMLLQEGEYGGYRYYQPETVRLFTQRQFETSRRGLGWDKPIPNDINSPTSLYASPRTFGHTGFTGTCIWVDPQFNLVYIFLSNRVHPDMTNNKLLNANIRSRIQDAIYESIFDYCVKNKTEITAEPNF
ncbi:serine hydrolase [Chryseosolibacter indicus]|uniref:Serine hydrolase n=1 Tax=Chryseosolibacter indicus TaxID=2782351 RepID=A0ABS5VW99_9BACT|nr:serine hydrolase [Chryseosolibacter indicus]MBT1705097.1 serine hydrolase [Chryseosolibacter indicus]